MSKRTPIVVGNWKMHTDLAAAVELAKQAAAVADELEGLVEVGCCPPFVYIHPVAAAVAGSRLLVGGQDVWPEAQGAFTGEVSPGMLADVGADLVLAGHSECRHVCGGQSDELVGRKTAVALASGLRVILCIGEKLEEREAGQTDEVTARQLRAGLAGVPAEHLDRLVIAYEPVWAIGSGRTASPEDAQAAHAAIRAVLAELYPSWDGAGEGAGEGGGGSGGADVAPAESVRIQYGGSMNAGNAAGLFAQPDIDGGLVGGASLRGEEFAAIARAAARVRA